MARIKTPAIQVALEVDLSILSGIVNEYTAEARAIAQDSRWAEDHKEKLTRDQRDTAAARFRVSAAEMLKRRRGQLEDLHKDLEKASAKSYKGIDANRVAIFERLVAGELAGADSSVFSTTGRQSALEKASALYEQYRRQSNREALLALDAAARRLADDGTPEGSAARGRLIHALDEWRAEEEAPAREVAQKIADTQAALDALRQPVRVAETMLTDYRPHPFSPVSPWAQDLLGERVEDYGGGIHVKTEAVALGG